MIKMQSQQKWLWDHAAYLFFGGLGGAAYVIGAVAGLKGGIWIPISRIGIGIAFPSVAIGALFLFIGLGSPLKAIYAWKCPGTSWIARGVLFITAFMVVAALHLGLWIWPSTILQGAVGLRSFISILGIILGFSAMLYTGFLLSAARPIAFWSTGILPAIFLVSALTSGLLAVLLFAGFKGVIAGFVLMRLQKAAILLLIALAFLLFFHMQATHRVPEGQRAAAILLRETHATLFWCGVVVFGIAVPLLLFAISVSAGGSTWMVASAAISGLFGSLCLRQAILCGGVLARLKAGSFEYTVTNP